MNAGQSIRIGGASGFWGEAAYATRQLLAAGSLDYIVYDYLAEITMSIMARARAKDAALGYATDFVTSAMAPNLTEISRLGIKVISNAGGVNPNACADALRETIARAGVHLDIAVVSGDDLLSRAEEYAAAQTREMFSDEAFPDPAAIASVNAYLGAFPIAKALDEGADIVITGRCVDSAVTLGACIHAFGWNPADLDCLAAGSLAGHIIECGPQATGGNFTDWRDAGDTTNIGYPIVEIEQSGRFTVTKPDNTGGLVSRATVCEQMLYEIADPRAYVLADVVCDFSHVEIGETGKNMVRVGGARGYPATDRYKVSATYSDGFRGGQVLTFNGFEARAKAQAFADAVIARSRALLRQANAPEFSEVSIEALGGASGGGQGYEEIMLKIAVRHPEARAVGLFLKELVGMALASPPGLAFFTGGGRPRPSPVVRLFSFLSSKASVPVSVTLNGKSVPFAERPATVSIGNREAVVPPPQPPEGKELVTVPLIDLAYARSGDKGDDANIGVIARQPENLQWIWQALTTQAIAARFAPFLKGHVDRYYLPGTHSMNIVLHNVLGGGGVASLRNDAQGKGYAQMLLALPVPVPRDLAANAYRKSVP